MNNQLLLSLQLNEEARLDEFVWGNNLVLRDIIAQFLQQEDGEFIYLWGELGAGKSHLLQAICQTVDSTGIYLPLQYLQEFEPEIICDLSQEVICIDDVQAISHKRPWEISLFNLYNRAKEEGKKLIFSANSPPGHLSLLPDLKSRLSFCLVFNLLELNDEDKLQILCLQAGKRGFELPYGVAEFIIRRCGRSMHSLNSILQKLDEASLQSQKKITIPFAKQILNLY
jgi:DnaA family protein